MGGMLEILRNAWKIPDLRKKLLFTIGMIIVYRIGTRIPDRKSVVVGKCVYLGGGRLI